MQDFFRRNHFLLRRLHSLTGIIPVGGFLLFHFYENAKSLYGAEAYNEAVRFINSLPMVWALEIFGIFLPLYFHAIYGIYISMDAKHNVGNYGYGRNWAFYFQRLSGIITLFFVTYHIWHFRFQKLLGAYGPYLGGESMSGLPTFDIVKEGLSHPVVLAVYIIGIVASSYHLTNGIYTFLITWGITIGPKSQRVSNLVMNTAFVLVSALGLVSLVGFLQ
jgi:succinate dehydrogenase / fumarate reductase, cytochrome b subunit